MATKAGITTLIKNSTGEAKTILRAAEFNTVKDAIQKLRELDAEKVEAQVLVSKKETNYNSYQSAVPAQQCQNCWRLPRQNYQYPPRQNYQRPLRQQQNYYRPPHHSNNYWHRYDQRQFHHNQGFQTPKFGNQQRVTPRQNNTNDSPLHNGKVVLAQQEAESSANYQQQDVEEAHRSNEEEHKYHEEEARQRFDKEEAKRKEDEESERQLLEMVKELYKEKNEEQQVSNNINISMKHRNDGSDSSTSEPRNDHDNEEDIEDDNDEQLELQQVFKLTINAQQQNEDQESEEHRAFQNSYDDEKSEANQLRRKSTTALRERSAIPPTQKSRKRKKKKRTSKSDTYYETNDSHADFDNWDRFRKNLGAAAVKRHAATTDSDKWLDVDHEAELAAETAVAKKVETIEIISEQRQECKEATDALTTVYAVKENGDPNQEDEADDHLDRLTLRPSDGRWVPPAA
ncbi:myb-like protein X [Anopheles bellator]|uniref:myb-like protein X n=1 Tax=Anopheles bellator TaxID=139047 RepID=UPI0026491FE6|nr:myb-like protein X [Anopheles bellator]